MNKNEEKLKTEIKRLKRSRLILAIYLIASMAVMLYNAVAKAIQ